MPSPLANSMSRTRRLADLADAAGRASSSSTVAVWIESTTSRRGPLARATSTIRPMSCSARTSIALARLAPASSPSRAGAQPDLRADSSPVAYSTARPDAAPPPGAAASTCRCPARRRAGSASPGRSRRRAPGRARRCRVGSRGTSPRRCPPGRWRRRCAPRRRVRARPSRHGRLADDRLDEAVPLAARRGTGPPSAGRPRRIAGRRIGSWPARHGDQCASTGVRARRRGCPGRPPGPCRRRSSCRS